MADRLASAPANGQRENSHAEAAPREQCEIPADGKRGGHRHYEAHDSQGAGDSSRRPGKFRQIRVVARHGDSDDRRRREGRGEPWRTWPSGRHRRSRCGHQDAAGPRPDCRERGHCALRMSSAPARDASNQSIGTGGQDQPHRYGTGNRCGMPAEEQSHSDDRERRGNLGEADRRQPRALEPCSDAVSGPCDGQGRAERGCRERTCGRRDQPLEQVSVPDGQRQADSGDRLGGRVEFAPNERPGSGQDQGSRTDQNRGTAERADQGPASDGEDRDGDNDERCASPEQQARGRAPRHLRAAHRRRCGLAHRNLRRLTHLRLGLSRRPGATGRRHMPRQAG